MKHTCAYSETVGGVRTDDVGPAAACPVEGERAVVVGYLPDGISAVDINRELAEAGREEYLVYGSADNRGTLVGKHVEHAGVGE